MSHNHPHNYIKQEIDDDDDPSTSFPLGFDLATANPQLSVAQYLAQQMRHGDSPTISNYKPRASTSKVQQKLEHLKHSNINLEQALPLALGPSKRLVDLKKLPTIQDLLPGESSAPSTSAKPYTYKPRRRNNDVMRRAEEIKQEVQDMHESMEDKAKRIMASSSSTAIMRNSCPSTLDQKKVRPLNIDTSVSVNQPSACSLNACGICGPRKSEASTVDEPLIESRSKHSQTVHSDPIDSFWIMCDACLQWFHGKCVRIEEYQEPLMEKFHCVKCTITHGPTIMKPYINQHRLAFDAISQHNLPTEVGTKTWIEEFIQREKYIPHPTAQEATIFATGHEFMDKFDRKSDWKKVCLIRKHIGLELRMPDPSIRFSYDHVIDIFGRNHAVDTIDVYRQCTQNMTLGSFVDKMKSTERTRLYNILSLEFSGSDRMRELVAPPILVPELSFVHKLWPDSNDPINWDPEIRQIVEVLEEHKKSKPEVALFCLIGMRGSYTDFHIDFGGSSVWYHIYKGRKIFYIIEPTPENLQIFEDYQNSKKKTENFLGDLLPPRTLKRVVIEQGETLMIPSGWIHAVYTPVDSLVFGGNFLHMLNIPMQLKIYDLEQRLSTDEKFMFPHFELVNWYAARSFILEHLREANDEGNAAEKVYLDAARALLPRLRDWMQRDKDSKMLSHSGFNDVLMKLQKELNKQDRISRSASPRKSSKKAKKRKSQDDEGSDEKDFESTIDHSLKLRIPRKMVEQSDEYIGNDSTPSTSAMISSKESEMPTTSRRNDNTSPTDFSVKLTRKGDKYSSSMLEKPSPIVDNVNMARMFARKSSHGRTPKPAPWLQAVAGEEIERTARQLQETEELDPRPVSTLSSVECRKELDRIMQLEGHHMPKKEINKKGSTETNLGTDQRGRVSQKKPDTAKQRLAKYMKMKI